MKESAIQAPRQELMDGTDSTTVYYNLLPRHFNPR